MPRNKVFKMIFSYIKKYWYIAIAIILLALVSVISMLLVPIYVGNSIDVIVEGNVNYSVINENVFLIVIMIIITFVSQWSLGYLNSLITTLITRDIRKDAFSNILKMPLSYIDTHPFGEIVSKVISDVDTFADGLLMGFTELFTGIITIVGTLVLMLKINYLVAIIVFVLTPISIIVARFIASRIHKYFTKQTETRANETSFVNEMINNLKVVQAFSHAEENMIEFKKVNEEFSNASLNAVDRKSVV